MAEYLKREDVLSNADIISVQTREYGTIDVVPLEYFADLPTADVEEVVRCAECRYASKCTDGYYACKVDHRLAHDEDDFCSYGERSDT